MSIKLDSSAAAWFILINFSYQEMLFYKQLLSSYLIFADNLSGKEKISWPFNHQTLNGAICYSKVVVI